MQSSVTLLRVRGIPIGVHWNWLLIFALVTWSLASSLFPSTYPGLSGVTYLAMAAAAALLFFASILLHELGHALRAQREGLPIEGITLWLLGGVAHLGELPPSPGAEFRVAILGPAISGALAVAFGVEPDRFDLYSRPPGVSPGRLNPFARRHHLYQPQAPALSRWGEYPWLLTEYFVPAADVEETDDAYVMDIDLPGVKQDEIDASMSGGRLTVAGERQPKREGVLRRNTRNAGRYRFEIDLPGPIDANASTATLSDGVLSLRLPKAASEQPRRIEVA
jgi:HSP20 family molecular chaperone IbpA